LVTGKWWPNLVNSVTGKITWAHQASEPVYVWGNTFNRVGYTNDAYWANSDSATIENRDYYLELPNFKERVNFNGSAGIGQGLLSGRPITCTPVVGYWATDTNTFYTCTVPNTWTKFYTPYTYPHPLAGSAGTPSVATSGPIN
jgi:hypothetical protein